MKLQIAVTKVTYNEDMLVECLLELAEDVGVFRGDAGSLQHRHPEGKHIPDPEVLQGRVKLAVHVGLQRILHFIRTSCEECRKTF